MSKWQQPREALLLDIHLRHIPPSSEVLVMSLLVELILCCLVLVVVRKSFITSAFITPFKMWEGPLRQLLGSRRGRAAPSPVWPSRHS